MSLSQTVPMSVYITAARTPPRSEPADNQLRLPGAIPRRALSTALLVRQMAPIAITFFDAFGAADGASQEHVTGGCSPLTQLPARPPFSTCCFSDDPRTRFGVDFAQSRSGGAGGQAGAPFRRRPSRVTPGAGRCIVRNAVMTQVDDKLLRCMVTAIVDAADPEQVILFGSRARGRVRRCGKRPAREAPLTP